MQNALTLQKWSVEEEKSRKRGVKYASLLMYIFPLSTPPYFNPYMSSSKRT